MKTTTGNNRDLFIAIPLNVFDGFGGGLRPTDWSVLGLIYRQVDFKTGFWNGSAAKVAAAWHGCLAKRTIQRALDRLCDLGYIKSFRRPGRHGNYLVAIDGYVIRSGPHSGQVLDAANTSDTEHPKYAERGNLVSPRNQRTCHRGDEDSHQRQGDDVGDSNPSEGADLQGISQCHVMPKSEKKSAKNTKRVTEEEGGVGSYVARIQDIQQQQHHDVGGSEKQNPNPATQEKEFLAEVYRTLDSHGASHAATQIHQKKTLALSAEYGSQVFLQALDCWLTEDGANWQRTARRYPLAHFVTSGKFEYYVPRIQQLADQSSRAAVEIERQRGEAEIARRRQAIKEQLIREEDAVGVEFADWQTKSGSADGFVPSDAPAFERYVERERLQQWTAESCESWADLDSQRRSVIGAAIEARLAEATQ